jgi:hypothetical protein
VTVRTRYVFVSGSHATSHMFWLPIRSAAINDEIATVGQYHVGFRSVL